MATILVAEDDLDVAQVLVRLLVHLGHVCQYAPDGRTTLARLKAQLFDILVADLNLPDLSGHDFIGQVIRIAPHVCIVACSGRIEQEETAALADYILSKPFSLNDLRAMVTALMPA